MINPENITAQAEIQQLLEFTAYVDTRWAATRNLVADVAKQDRVLGACVQAITDGFEAKVQHGDYATVFLLEVVRRLDPAVADAAAGDLAMVGEDGQVGYERLGEWREAVSADQPMKLYIDVPEAGTR